MDWVRVGGLVILPDGSVSEILSISEDNGILAKDNTQWFCRSELLPLTKENMVKTLNGVLPPEPHPDALLQDVPYNFYVYEEDVFCKWRIAVGWSNKKICTISEFKQLAKELNKEKQMTDWYDYENKKAISLPPVGEIVITYSDRIDKEFKVKILEHTNNGVSDICVCREINDLCPNLGGVGYYSRFKPLDWEKDVRKDKLIDTVYNLMCDMGGDLRNRLDKIYDLGYLKFPEEK